jgi:hypothetical protein
MWEQVTRDVGTGHLSTLRVGGTLTPHGQTVGFSFGCGRHKSGPNGSMSALD